MSACPGENEKNYLKTKKESDAVAKVEKKALT